jgi:hypothetical protein
MDAMEKDPGINRIAGFEAMCQKFRIQCERILGGKFWPASEGPGYLLQRHFDAPLARCGWYFNC